MLEGSKLLGAGAATIALAGAAVGIGNVFSSLIHSVARNPSFSKQLFFYVILGFALTEAIALFALIFYFHFYFGCSFLLLQEEKEEDEAPLLLGGERRVGLRASFA